MKKLEFTKMVASGNDFVLVQESIKRFPIPLRKSLKAIAEGDFLVFGNYHLPFTIYHLPNLAKKICDRKYGIGADGLLFLEKSKKADIKMRIFNADGSEAEMCGNGARCAALFVAGSPVRRFAGSKEISIETKAGIINAEVNKDTIKIKLTDPKSLKLDIPLMVNGRKLKVNFINTGVPHTVIFVDAIGKIDVVGIGRAIRYHKKFAPAGTNVNFVEILDKGTIRIRTYERGVEGETLACGTGSVASALITVYRLPFTVYRKMKVITKSGEILKIYFERIGDKFKNVWLEGRAKIVYKGEYN